MKRSVRAVCESCGGTGLYSGMCEATGEAVVCLGCSGTGAETITYEPFVKRRRRKGIKTVRLSSGSFVGTAITAAAFYAGEMPCI